MKRKRCKRQESVKKQTSTVHKQYTIKELIELGEKTNYIELAKKSENTPPKKD